MKNNGILPALAGIRAILMAHHTAGVCLPSAAKGVEREVLVREFLAEVFPPPFRFGSGAIVDATGAMSGQLDIVVEFPFLPSFPTPGARERLYLAESAALVIEVKSDLNEQWEQVQGAAKKVLLLRRNWRAHEAFGSKGNHATFAATTSCIPFLAVGYRGPAIGEALAQKLKGAPEDETPDAILVRRSRLSGRPLGSLMNFSTKPTDTNQFVRRHVRTGDPF